VELLPFVFRRGAAGTMQLIACEFHSPTIWRWKFCLDGFENDF
jgi:hypothetical protein